MNKRQRVDLTKSVEKLDPYADREDPGRVWCDFVMACKKKDKAAMQELITLAEKSEWTHEDYDLALEGDYVYEDEYDTDEYEDQDDADMAAGSVEE